MSYMGIFDVQKNAITSTEKLNTIKRYLYGETQLHQTVKNEKAPIKVLINRFPFTWNDMI